MAKPLTIQRSGSAQVDILTPATDTTAGAITYTAAQMMGGLILRDPNGDNRSDVTPTAALLVAGMPIQGQFLEASYQCRIINTANGNETITVTAGDGVTLVPATVTIAQNENALLLIRFVTVAGGSEAVTIYAMVAGG